jgi:hypothetical protein
MTEFLNLNDIKKLPDVPIKEIEIPAWKTKVKVKGLTKKAQVELARIASKGDAFDYQKELLKQSIIEPELDDEAVELLYEKDATVIDSLFVEIADLNGIGNEVQSALAEEFQE